MSESDLRDTMVPRIDMATEAHEEWRDRAGVDPALDMRALVTLIWSADLGLGVLGRARRRSSRRRRVVGTDAPNVDVARSARCAPRSADTATDAP